MWRLAELFTVLLMVAGCVSRPPDARSALSPGASPQAIVAADIAVTAEADRLRLLLAEAVPQGTFCNAGDAPRWVDPARSAMARALVSLQRPQLVVVVDRSLVGQELCILLAAPHAAWQPIGGSKISTGQAGRRGYFITPLGVFRHTEAIIDYRAEGTFNENHIRGLGIKGMRVWDFGWQQAVKGWANDAEPSEIRLLMHATDPDILERRLGQPASKGCIRLPAALNRFLDRHGILDADYEQAAASAPRIAAVLLPDRESTPLAGDLLVIIDGSEANR